MPSNPEIIKDVGSQFPPTKPPYPGSIKSLHRSSPPKSFAPRPESGERGIGTCAKPSELASRGLTRAYEDHKTASNNNFLQQAGRTVPEFWPEHSIVKRGGDKSGPPEQPPPSPQPRDDGEHGGRTHSKRDKVMPRSEVKE